LECKPESEIEVCPALLPFKFKLFPLQLFLYNFHKEYSFFTKVPLSLAKIAAEDIVSGVLVVFGFFHFMWALLMEVVSMFQNIYLSRTTL
jgi:hypothetical protein